MKEPTLNEPSMYRVNLSLRSRQQAGDEEPEVIEQTLEAWLKPVPSGVILYYEEVAEDDRAATQAELHISEHQVSLKRSGGQTLEMHFKLDAPHDVLYETPYGRFPLKINTKRISFAKQDNPVGSCKLRYELAFEGQAMLNHQLDVAWSPPATARGESHDQCR